jgi:hypothetical protein
LDSQVLRYLVLIACFLSGALAGINIDSVIVRFPAWRRLGATAWAAYRRKADLGNGLFLYPLLAIGHALIIIAIAIDLYFRGPVSAIPTAFVAASFAIIGLLLTIRAAPIMLGLNRDTDDPQAIENDFRGFARRSLV